MCEKIMLPERINAVIERLREHGFKGYVVGGCVRDMLMGKIPHDFDITTDAFPEEICEIFSDHRVILTGLKHGTVTVVHEGENVEITTFRTDGKYLDNRHPEKVTFVRNITEDLSRRDFTVNAMAYNPQTGLVDLFGGCDDIKNRTIRCVGDANRRFNEDGLRILRAMRFACVLGFEIEKSTASAVLSNKHLLSNISCERIYSELTKLILGDGAVDILHRFYPILVDIMGDVPKENIDIIGNLPHDHSLRYAALLANRTASDAVAVMRSLKTDNETCRTVRLLVASISIEFPRSDSDRFDKECAYLLSKYPKDDLSKMISLRRAFCLSDQEILSELDRIEETVRMLTSSNACVSIKQLAVDGGELAAIGVPKTSEMGDLLQKLLESVIEGETANEKEALLERAKELII